MSKYYAELVQDHGTQVDGDSLHEVSISALNKMLHLLEYGDEGLQDGFVIYKKGHIAVGEVRFELVQHLSVYEDHRRELENE